MSPRDRRDIYDNADEARIHNEVIILEDEEAEAAQRQEDDAPWYDYDEDDTPFIEDENKEQSNESMNPWTLITTGRILTEGSLPYYRYFIAIAIMCFFSIFLTFMSLNANREYRQREKYASVLHERAVLKEEEKYGLSSKRAVTARLKSYDIELIDLSKDSRLIER
jgi:hypothetical protein